MVSLMPELPVQWDDPLCTTINCDCYKILVRSEVQLVVIHHPWQYQGAKGAAGTRPPIEIRKFLRRFPGHQPRGWMHNEAPRTRIHGELTLSVWLRIQCCRNQEGSCIKPPWTSTSLLSIQNYCRKSFLDSSLLSVFCHHFQRVPSNITS